MSLSKLLLLIALLAVGQMIHLQSYENLNISSVSFPQLVIIAPHENPKIGIRPVSNSSMDVVVQKIAKNLESYWVMNEIIEMEGVFYTFRALDGRYLLCPKPRQLVKVEYYYVKPEINYQFILREVTTPFVSTYTIQCREPINPYLISKGQIGNSVILDVDTHSSILRVWEFLVD